MNIGDTVVDFSEVSAEIFHIIIHNALILVSVNAELGYVDLLLMDRLVSFVVLLN